MAVPTHHRRQEICATRLPYREGRKPKAVKVYTVSQESKYVLIHGVPAVGATEELIKLCALYGAVEEYRPLDDYPTEQFSEVYLIKYQKIQAARFVKRKLDDWSFFGGVLHVCYAPEFESVQETREKLQERRRTIAIKLKRHATEIKPTVLNQFQETVCLEAGSNGIDKNGVLGNDKLCTTADITVAQEHQFFVALSNTQDVGPERLHLPPPPQPDFSRAHQHLQPHQEFARVPTAHATLPLNYDGRLTESDSSEVNMTCHSSNVNITGKQSTLPSSEKNHSKTVKKTTNCVKAKEGGIQLKKSDEIIIRQFKKDDRAIPRFIPRQTIKSIKSTPSSEDPVNKTIKKNAFTLRDAQGPKNEPSDELESVTTQETEKSVRTTILDIRKRISEFSSEPYVQRIKRVKTS